MFPWVYGFHWTPGHVIFTGIFLAVAITVAATVSLAFFRSYLVFRRGKAGQVAWQSLFHDLPASDRACRHAMTGELAGRVCDQGFDCRQCAMHASLLQRAPQTEQGRLYHRGHTWVEQSQDGTLLIGLDDLAARLIGPAGHIDVPPAGARIEANTPAFTIRKKGAVLRLLAPVDGAVVASNPTGQGWLARLRPVENCSNAHLLSGVEAQRWFQFEIDRPQLAASGACGLPALADGGVLVDDISSVLPGNLWESVCGEILLDV
jgi:glycine cleavage system H lipoate-binding protein